jgi:serine/threonine protein kinase
MSGHPSGAHKLGKYRRIVELGRGGMATVYLAAMRGPQSFTKLVVVKELKPELAVEASFRTMFLDEARTAARLNHPNVVQTYEVGEEEDGAYVIVMEYLEGQPLNRVRNQIARGEHLFAAQLQIVSDVLSGLEYAHEATDFDGTPLRIVHRDISPHNIFITYSGEVKIVDFGIAKASDSSNSTSTGTLKGKLAYMPPEQATGERVDGRADVFSVGVVLWEAVAQRRLWQGLPDVAILSRLMTGEIPSLAKCKEGLAPELEAIVMRSLAPLPANRYPNAATFRRELDKYRASLPVTLDRRQLGQMISDAFLSERQEIKRTIEEQLKIMKDSATGEFRPIKMVPVDAPSGPIKFIAPEHSQQFIVHRTPPPPPPPEHSNTGVGAAALPPRVSEHPPWHAQKGASVGVLALVGLLGIAAVASIIGLVAVIRLTPGPAPSPVVATSSPTAADPTPTNVELPQARQVRLAIHPSPANTLVTLDGQPITTGADPVIRATDNVPHHIHADARGYVPKDAVVFFDVDHSVDIVLERSSAGSTPPKKGPGTGSAPKSSEPDLGF